MNTQLPVFDPPTVGVPWLVPILIEINCKTRILMVTDGLTFGSAAFGLGEAIDTVEAAGTTDHPVVVTKATRNAVDATADVVNFTFDGTHTVNGANRTIDFYEEIWIFGVGSLGSMPADEIDALEAFMDEGGGVFATGDHNELGAFMSSDVKRIGSMRLWRNAAGAPDGFAPTSTPGGPSGRIDTTVPNQQVEDDFDLQSDNIPQRIYPRYYESLGVVTAHDLLQRHDVDGPIAFMPDHAHEGLVVEPVTLDPVEYPNAVAPEIVAWGVSGGAGGKPAVIPKVFGIVGAYDGHQAGVGRIVVDSTWHHWININLNGTGAGALAVPADGLYDGAAPTPEYEQIKDYFQNIAGWLEPDRVRICITFPWWIKAVFASPLTEELLVFDGDFGLVDAIQFGAIARRSVPSELRAKMLEAMLATLDIDPRLKALIDPTSVQGRRDFKALDGLSPFFDRTRIVDALFGSVAFEVRRRLSMEPDQAAEQLRGILKVEKGRFSPDGFAEVVNAGAMKGLDLVSAELGRPSAGLTALRRALPEPVAG